MTTMMSLPLASIEKLLLEATAEAFVQIYGTV
jgi:hypothetical protein